MSDVPEVLFKIGIEELSNDNATRFAFYRCNSKSIGEFLAKAGNQHQSIFDSVKSSATLFVGEWNKMGYLSFVNPPDPALICITIWNYKEKTYSIPNSFEGFLDWRYSKAPELLEAADLNTLASLWKARHDHASGTHRVIQTSEVSENTPLSQKMRIAAYSLARSIYPLWMWGPTLWLKFTPEWALNEMFQDHLFPGSVHTRIRNVAENEHWGTFGDFVRLDHQHRYRVRNFAGASSRAIRKKIDELASHVPIGPSIEFYRPTPILEMFEAELKNNPLLMERWAETLRLLSGLYGPVLKKSEIADRFDVSINRIRQYETDAWHKIKAREPWRSLAVHRIRELIRESFRRLTLEAVEEEEPWFLGISRQSQTIQYIIRWISDSSLAVATDGTKYFVREVLGSSNGQIKINPVPLSLMVSP